MNTPSSRSRGRPRAHLPAARARILDAFATLLESAPWDRPSLRLVAQGAGVSPALVHYHFDDQPGLLRSLLEERALPLLRPALPAAPLPPDLDAGAALVRFLQKWTALVQQHRWIAACLLQLPAERPQAAIWEPLRALVAMARQQGSIRRDLPDSYASVLLLALGAMPVLAHSGLGAGLDRAGFEGDAAHLTLRHLSVLQAGIAQGAGRRS